MSAIVVVALTLFVLLGSSQASEPGNDQESEAFDNVQAGPGTPTDCLPDELRALLADVAAQFGTVTLVATHQLPMNNHARASAREKLHLDCKAVDLKVQGRQAEIMAYLRSRSEVGGLEAYRDGVIHVDLHAGLRGSLPGASNDGSR